MTDTIEFRTIAHIHSDFGGKFGIPRQSGMIEELKSTVVFVPEFRNPDAVRALEGYSHIWLLWLFSRSVRETWSPTVRPPMLGGNTKVGVFASRSPFRPNPIGLSCVRLERVDLTDKNAPVLHIAGADLMDGTPILDIKPYLPYADAHPQALGGFAVQSTADRLQVVFPDELLEIVPTEKQSALLRVLALDPRPTYQEDPSRIYGFCFAGLEIRFTVQGDVLTVCSVEEC